MVIPTNRRTSCNPVCPPVMGTIGHGSDRPKPIHGDEVEDDSTGLGVPVILVCLSKSDSRVENRLPGRPGIGPAAFKSRPGRTDEPNCRCRTLGRSSFRARCPVNPKDEDDAPQEHEYQHEAGPARSPAR
jgi:hypothetical protein